MFWLDEVKGSVVRFLMVFALPVAAGVSMFEYNHSVTWAFVNAILVLVLELGGYCLFLIRSEQITKQIYAELGVQLPSEFDL